MKTLLVYSGGHPRNADDLVHIQAGMSEAIISLVKGLLSDGVTIPNCVLYGFNVTATGGGFTTYAAGAAILGGEICQFDGATVASALVNPDHYVIRTSDTYAANNPVTYGDASTKNVHLIRKAVIASIAVATGANEIELADRMQFKDVLKANLFSANNSWVVVGAGGAPSYANGFLGAPVPVNLRFCKLVSGLVILEGGMEWNGIGTVANFVDITFSTPIKIFTLPDGWRPDAGTAFAEVSVESPDGWATFSIQVFANGDVNVIKAYNIGGGVTPASYSSTTSWARMSLQFRAAV